MILFDVPVEPDAETAREWVERELESIDHNQSESLLSKLLSWLNDTLNLFSSIDFGAANAPVLVAVLVALIIAVALSLRFIGPIRRRSAARAKSVEVLEDDPRSAAEMRAAASAAAASGDWTGALLDSYRATIRGMEERIIIDARDGRTAYEAAVDGGAALPTLARDLRRASALFDAVCYGHTTAAEDSYRTVADVEASVRAAKPAALELS